MHNIPEKVQIKYCIFLIKDWDTYQFVLHNI